MSKTKAKSVEENNAAEDAAKAEIATISQAASPVGERRQLNVKVVKAVTLPLLKFTQNQPEFVTIKTEFYEGKEIPNSTMGVPTLCEVHDLSYDRPAEMLVTAVMQSELEKSYPDGAYVGKTFQITKTNKTSSQGNEDGKRYNLYAIQEVEVS